jgi:hypothetical protein
VRRAIRPRWAAVGFALTVIIDAVDQAGITARKTRVSDLRDYWEGNDES